MFRSTGLSVDYGKECQTEGRLEVQQFHFHEYLSSGHHTGFSVRRNVQSVILLSYRFY